MFSSLKAVAQALTVPAARRQVFLPHLEHACDDTNTADAKATVLVSSQVPLLFPSMYQVISWAELPSPSTARTETPLGSTVAKSTPHTTVPSGSPNTA